MLRYRGALMTDMPEYDVEETTTKSISSSHRNRWRNRLAISFLALVLLWIFRKSILKTVIILFRILLPFWQRGFRPCLPPGTIPLNANGVPSHRFGVAFLHVNPKKDARQETIMRLSEQNRLDYCNRHNYTFLNGTEWFIQNRHELEDVLNPRWLKTIYMRHVQKTHPELDWTLYLDSDIIIMRMDMGIDQLLVGTAPDQGIILSEDGDGINSGAWIVSHQPVGRKVIDKWLEGPITLPWPEPPGNQQYLKQIIDQQGRLISDSSVRVKMNPGCALQSGGGLEWSSKYHKTYFEGAYGRGDFAVHFFGRHDKVEQMKTALSGSLAFFS